MTAAINKAEVAATLVPVLDVLKKQLAEFDRYFAVTSITSTPYCVVMLDSNGIPSSTLNPLDGGGFNFSHTGTPKMHYTKDRAEAVAKLCESDRVVAYGIYDYNKARQQSTRAAVEYMERLIAEAAE